MFTVKIDRACGDELIIEGREVSRDERGLLIQTESESILIGPGGYQMAIDYAYAQGTNTKKSERDVGFSAGVDLSQLAPASPQAAIFVMNRYGATVAKYSI